MSERTPCPSDLSDEQWSLTGAVITPWKDRHRSVSGHQGAYVMREIVNAILYQGRTGCQWAHLPNDLPPKSATYYYFAAWRDGTDQAIHELLRCQVREKARRSEDPAPAVLDTQSLHAAAGVRASTTGRDQLGRGFRGGADRAVVRFTSVEGVTIGFSAAVDGSTPKPGPQTRTGDPPEASETDSAGDLGSPVSLWRTAKTSAG